MDAEVRIKTHVQPGGERVATVTTSTGRVLRIVGVTGRLDYSGDVVDAMKHWITWERRGRQCK